MPFRVLWSFWIVSVQFQIWIRKELIAGRDSESREEREEMEEKEHFYVHYFNFWKPYLFTPRWLCLLCCSVTKLCPTPYDPMDCGMPGFLVHCLREFAQTHVRWVGDAIQPSHLLSPFSFRPQSFPASGAFPMSWPCGYLLTLFEAPRLADWTPHHLLFQLWLDHFTG